MIHEFITSLLGGSIDNLGELIVYFMILAVLITFILIALLLFGIFLQAWD